MIRIVLRDINFTGHFPSPIQCFPLKNFNLNCNDSCFTCLGYPTVSLNSPHGTDEARMNNAVTCFDVELIIHIYRLHIKSIFLVIFCLPYWKAFSNCQSYGTMSSL